MSHGKRRLTALTGCVASILVLAGCGAREPVEAPPTAIAPGYAAAEPPELMGAPPAPSAPADGLLGGPAASDPSAPTDDGDPRLRTWRRPDGKLVTAMAPIANPEAQPDVPRRAVRHTPRIPAAPSHELYAATPASRPVARPPTRPVGGTAPKPATAAAAQPSPLRPVVAAQPAAPLAKAPAPVLAAAAPAGTTSAAPRTRLQQLQAAVALDATNGAVLASAESLAKGQEGQVTLSLPATLADGIKAQARTLGLAKAARRISAHADLQGEGYEITPNGRQTTAVKPGQPATFAWNVKPTAAAKGPLKAEFGVALNGARPARSFALGAITKQVVPAAETLEKTGAGLKLALPDLGGLETIDVPGVGKIPGRSVLGGVLLLLALLIVVAIARSASAAQARAERHRRFRTQTGYDRNDAPAPQRPAQADPASPPAEHNPFDTPIQGHAQPKELERTP